MVEVCGAPVVVDVLFVSVALGLGLGLVLGVDCRRRGRGRGLGREVMQQSRLGGCALLHHALQVPSGILCDLAFGVAITRPGDQDGRVDDQGDKLLGAGAEARDVGVVGPDVGRGVFLEAVPAVGAGALEGLVLVEGAVDVVAPLQRVDHARPEGFLAVRPAHEVLGRGFREGVECGLGERGEAAGVRENCASEVGVGWREVFDDEDTQGGWTESGEEGGMRDGGGLEIGEGNCDWGSNGHGVVWPEGGAGKRHCDKAKNKSQRYIQDERRKTKCRSTVSKPVGLDANAFGARHAVLVWCDCAPRTIHSLAPPSPSIECTCLSKTQGSNLLTIPVP